eukprot:CAMPEP_0197942112 /NCGR_PEP_ID=MMETSP1439-20131203/123843_1 /TAXON_ID=66791 /ORGANISM="Gonyaulax spinifera, Strain CCMP409" /LENGTH=58 /DNA_ID=CAMNT_0043565353 /DNA_START=37 /DNA_END=213 /DNA_ORIENTATION=-
MPAKDVKGSQPRGMPAKGAASGCGSLQFGCAAQVLQQRAHQGARCQPCGTSDICCSVR